MLDEVFEAKVGRSKKTLLEFAEEEGVKKEVEGVIRDAEISIDGDNQPSTFWSRNQGKIAFGGVGSLFLIGGVAAAMSTLGQPLIGAAAIGAIAAAVIVGAVMLLVSVLAITTDRGYEEWNRAQNTLSDLFVSQPESKEIEI